MDGTFADFLLSKIQEYEREQGRRVTLDEFADHLHVKRPSVSQWLGGKIIPSLESAFIMAPVLGPDVFLYLNLDLDADLVYLNQHWEMLNPEARKAIREAAEIYVAQNRGESGSG
jgi:plasmid maintenance system antidote protein VapI